MFLNNHELYREPVRMGSWWRERKCQVVHSIRPKEITITLKSKFIVANNNQKKNSIQKLKTRIERTFQTCHLAAWAGYLMGKTDNFFSYEQPLAHENPEAKWQLYFHLSIDWWT